MATVTGKIGNEDVSLENAATEATLKQLLAQAKTSADAIKKLASALGVDASSGTEAANEHTEAVEESTDAVEDNTSALEEQQKVVEELTARSVRYSAVVNGLDAITRKLMAGSANLSDVFGELGQLPGYVGLIFRGFERLAAVQEENFKAYQSLTSAGVNFGGSLTKVRESAASSYLTLDKFTEIIQKNSKTLAKMGGDANTGAEAFAKLNKAMYAGDTGQKLMTLGYTSEQISNSMLSYVEATGGRSKKELANSDALIKSSAEYMANLNGLSTLTGESREQLEQQMKEQAANAAWQAKLATMSEEEKAKAISGLQNALAVGGKGAADAFQSRVLGIPPITEAAKTFTATMGNTNESIMRSADNVTDATKTVADQNNELARAVTGNKNDMAKYGETLRGAVSMMGGAFADVVAAGTKTELTLGKKNEAEIKAIMATKERQATEAAAMSDAQMGMKSLGAALWQAFGPIIRVLTPVLALFGKITGFLGSIIEKGGMLSTVVIAAIAAFILLKNTFLATAAMNAQKNLANMMRGGGGGGILGAPTPGTGGVAGPLGGGAGSGGAGGGPGGMVGGLADGLAKLGPMLKSLGQGFGGLVSGVLRGIAVGLRAFANPMVVLGAAGLAASITIIGAGIAAASWIMGKALPTLAEGLKGFSDIDGGNLIKVGAGIGALGIGLVAFAAGNFAASAGGLMSNIANGIGKLFGGESPVEKIQAYAKLGPGLKQAGDGLRVFNTELLKLVALDLGKIDAVANSMKKLKAAAPDASIGATVKTLVTNFVASINAAADAKEAKSSDNSTASELRRLNSSSMEMLKVMRDVSDHMKRNVGATKDLNRNLFPT